MKLQINPFLEHLFRENASYIFMALILVISLFFVPRYMVGKYFENKTKIGELEEKVNQIKVKENILLASRNEEIQNIDEDVRILKSLIPDSENHFTIIYALEELSRQTNFIITSYTLNLTGSNLEKTSLTVTGIGDQESFLRFLKNYNFAGGRLITAEKIEFNQSQFGGSTITLNFYNKEVSSTEDQNVNYEEILKKIAEIRSKVNIGFLSDEDEISEAYPVESNPF